MRLAVRCWAGHPAIRSCYLPCSGIDVFRAFLPAVTKIKTGGFLGCCSTALLINGSASRSAASEYVSCPGLSEYLGKARSLFFSVTPVFLICSCFFPSMKYIQWFPERYYWQQQKQLSMQPLVRVPPCLLGHLELLKICSLLRVLFWLLRKVNLEVLIKWSAERHRTVLLEACP